MLCSYIFTILSIHTALLIAKIDRFNMLPGKHVAELKWCRTDYRQKNIVQSSNRGLNHKICSQLCCKVNIHIQHKHCIRTV